MPTRERKRRAETVAAAEEARDALAAAFADAGITLPSLRIDPVSCAGNEPAPLIELGRCNLPTARLLAETVAGAARGTTRP